MARRSYKKQSEEQKRKEQIQQGGSRIRSVTNGIIRSNAGLDSGNRSASSLPDGVMYRRENNIRKTARENIQRMQQQESQRLENERLRQEAEKRRQQLAEKRAQFKAAMDDIVFAKKQGPGIERDFRRNFGLQQRQRMDAEELQQSPLYRSLRNEEEKGRPLAPYASQNQQMANYLSQMAYKQAKIQEDQGSYEGYQKWKEQQAQNRALGGRTYQGANLIKNKDKAEAAVKSKVSDQLSPGSFSSYMNDVVYGGIGKGAYDSEEDYRYWSDDKLNQKIRDLNDRLASREALFEAEDQGLNDQQRAEKTASYMEQDEFENLQKLAGKTGDANWEYFKKILSRGRSANDPYQQEEYDRALQYVYENVRPGDYTTDMNVIGKRGTEWWDLISQISEAGPIEKIVRDANERGDDSDDLEIEIDANLGRGVDTPLVVHLEKDENGLFAFDWATDEATGETYGADRLDELQEQMGFSRPDLKPGTMVEQSRAEKESALAEELETEKLNKQLGQLEELQWARRQVADMEAAAPTGTYKDPQRTYNYNGDNPLRWLVDRAGGGSQQMDEADKAYWEIQEQRSSWNQMSTKEQLDMLEKLGYGSSAMNGLADSFYNTGRAQKQYYAFMTPEMQNTFEQYYKSGDKQGALAYLEALRNTGYLDMAASKYKEFTATENAMGPYGALYGLLSVPEQAQAGIIGTGAAIASGLGLKKLESEYDPLMQAQRNVTATRKGRSEWYGNKAAELLGEWAREPAKFVTNVGYSLADNVFATATGTAISGGDVNKAIRAVQLIMSGSATSSKLQENLEKNMDPGEAALSAIGNGIIEAITEKYSLEALLKPDVKSMLGNKRELLKYFAKVSGAEGSEEVASDLMNMGLDTVLSVIYDHENEITERYNALVDSGMKQDEALKKVWTDKLGEIGLSGLAGALSGLVMGGGRAALNSISNYTTGKNVKTNKNMERLLNVGLGMKEGTDSRAFAEQLKNSKGNPSNVQLGKLAQLMVMETGEEQGNVIKSTIENNVRSELQQAGVENAEEAAQVIARSLFEGTRLTAAERSILAKDQKSMDLWKEYNTLSAKSVGLRAEIAQNTQGQRSLIDKIGELTDSRARSTSALAAEVERSIRETKSAAEAVDNLRERRGDLMSEEYAQAAKEALESDPEAQKNTNYLDDAVKIRMAVFSLDKNMPETRLSAETAEKLRQAAQEEWDAAEKQRVLNQVKAQPGRGVMMLEGAEYGSDDFRAKLAGMKLTKQQRNQIGALGEIVTRMGNRLNLVNRPEQKGVYGFEQSDGTITINVAGMNRGGLQHHMLVTMSHELTHWLEQNSAEGYSALRQYVVDSLRSKGQDVARMMVDTIDNLNAVLGADSGESLDLHGAMAEIVAKSCENLLSSETFRNEIAKTNPSLYNKIRTFVKDFAARIRAAIGGMNESLSREARTLLDETERIAKLWLGARQEALGREKGTGTEAEPGISYSTTQLDNTENELRTVWSDARDQLSDARQKLDEMKPELNEWTKRMMDAHDNGTWDEVLPEYQKWEKGYNKVKEALQSAQDNYNKANKAFNDYIEQRDVAEEQKKIEESGLVEKEWRRKQAAKEFGYTADWREAGYMLPNGRLINFSGSKTHIGMRGEDHRGIGRIYASSEMQGSAAMVKFMSDGNIRVMAETPGIDIISTTEPTKEQYAAIRNMARRFAGEEYFNVDFTDERGNTVDSIEYDGRVNPERVVNDIKTFYRTGAAPQQSVVSQFHYSVAQLDEQYDQALENNDEATMQQLVDEAARRAGYTTPKLFHGTRDFGFTEFDLGGSGGMVFSTTDRRVAETYSGETQRSRINETVNIDTYNMDGEDLLDAAKKLFKKYKSYTLATPEMKERALSDARDSFTESIVKIKSYLELHKNDLSNLAINRTKDVISYLEEVRDSKSDTEAAKAWLKYEAGLWSLKWENEDMLFDMLNDDISKTIYEAKNKLSDFLYDEDIYIEDHYGNDRVLRSQLALEVNAENHKGIYELYGKPGKQLIIDAKGENWNQLTAPDEFNLYGLQRTRDIAEAAKAYGYDTVLIKNVKDRGGETPYNGASDVYIFFDANQLKSADPVTYDDEHEPIKPSERFSDSNDIRYSVQQAPDMDVNNFMLGLKEWNLGTLQERTMLRQYKDLQATVETLRMKIADRENMLRQITAKAKLTAEEQARYDELVTARKMVELTAEEQRELRLMLNKKNSLSAYDKEQVRKINNWLTNDRNRLDKVEAELSRVTGEKGYARMMMQQDTLMKNLVSGRTAGQLKDTVQSMSNELDDVNREMSERAGKLERLASSAAVLRIRTQFDNAGLKRIAARLKGEMNSELENREIENRLALIALKMKEGKFDSETTEELVDMMLGRMRGGYDSYVLQELRGSTFTLSKAQQQELKARDISIKDLNARMAGTGIRFTTEGNTTLEAKWGELADRIGSLQADENPLSMAETLADLVESEKKTVFAERFGNESVDATTEAVLKAASELVPEIVTDEKSLKMIREVLSYVEAVSRAAGESAAQLSDMEKVIDRLKRTGAKAQAQAGTLTGDISETIDYFNTLAEQSEAAMWKKERIQLIDQLNNEKTQALLMEQEKWKQRIEKDKAAREKMQDNLKLRKQITTNVSRVSKLLMNETDLKNIPEHMKSLARAMLWKVVENDLSGRKVTGIDAKDLLEIRRVLGVLNQMEEPFTLDDLRMINDEEAQSMVAEALADLEDGIGFYNNKNSSDMMATLQGLHSALEKISDAVSTITSVINAERSISFWDRKIAVADAAEDVRKELGRSRFKGERAGFGRKARNTASSAIFYGNMTPVYFFRMLRNGGMDAIWRDTLKGEDRNGLEMQKAKAYLQGLGNMTGYKGWADEKHEVVLGGQKRTLTIGNMMELYAIWQREKTLNPEMSQHLEKGGVYIQQEDNDSGKPRRETTQQRAVRVRDEEVIAMYGQMTEQQKAYLQGVVSYLSNEMSALGNEASMRMYGIKKYKETWYFPMKVWDGVKSARSDRGISGTDENRMAHKSWSKRRIHMAQNALVIGDFTQDAVNHIVEMINYNTMAPAIENLNKVLNYQFIEGETQDDFTKRNLRVMFQEAYGKEALKYLETFMKDMNGGVTQDQRKTLRDRAVSMFRKNAVAGSLSVVAQQPLSYIRAAMLINPKYMAPAPVKNNWKQSYREMMEHSGVAVIKEMGRFDMNFGQSAKDWITPETKGNAYEKISDVLTVAPQLADRMTWTWIWSAVKAETKAKNPGMDVNSDDFLNKVGERFNEVMRQTQVYDSVMVKSSNMRSQNLGMKMLTSFMAEPTLSLNVLADAVGRVRAGDKNAVGNMAKAAATFLLSAVLQAAVKGAIGTGRTPDEKKTWTENFLNKLQYNLMNEANPVSLIPGYSSLVELMKNGELKDDAMGAIGKIFQVRETMMKALSGEGKGWYRDLEDTAGQLSQLFTNIPAKNIMRDLRAMYNWVTQGAYAKRATSGAVLKEQAKANLATADNIVGVINKWMGEAGYSTSNKAYYARLYDAMKEKNEQKQQELTEYLTLGKGVKAETISTNLRTLTKDDADLKPEQKISSLREQGMKDSDIAEWITKQYKEGKLTKKQAEDLYTKANPAKTADDAYFHFEQADWENETGNDLSGDTAYFRLDEALDIDDKSDYDEAVKELQAHGYKADKIREHAAEKIMKKYRDGDRDRQTTMSALKKYAGLNDNDAWWKIDRVDYKKETGREESVTGYYYRLTDAVNANSAEQIKKAVDQLLKHGIEKKKIKDKLSDWKKQWMAANQQGRVKIQDALQKAYKAAGYTTADAKKTIDNWIKDSKKTKK